MSSESITRWVPAIGRWELNEPGRAVYLGPQPGQDRPYGICLSKSRFSEGEVRVTVQIPAMHPDISGRLLLGYRSLNAEYYTVGIGGNAFAYTLVHFQPGTGWRPLAFAGSEDALRPQQPYHLVLRVQGLRVTLSDGDITVFEHVLQSPLPVGQLGLFGWTDNLVEFTEMSVAEKRGTAFVVMQFTEPYKELYEEVVKKVAEGDDFKLEAFHAGEVFGRVILQDIKRGIEEARVIIAEITPANKNVFYEVGFAHALNKPTILLVAKGTELPFDIRGYRCILYENTIAGKRQVEEELSKHLEAILKG
jgi:hypothetical protein